MTGTLEKCSYILFPSNFRVDAVKKSKTREGLLLHSQREALTLAPANAQPAHKFIIQQNRHSTPGETVANAPLYIYVCVSFV